VGYLIGFIEPACEYSTEYWKVLMTVRDEIRYNVAKNSTYVFVKTAYKNKLKYHFQQLKEFTQDITRVTNKGSRNISSKRFLHSSTRYPDDCWKRQICLFRC
jgi:hypothetical protein